MSLDSRRLRRFLISFLIVSLEIIILIDVAPSTGATMDQHKKDIDYVLDKTGLWQGSWQLFAPNVDSVNSIITARLELADSRIIRWRSPSWGDMSLVERFVRFRESEFYDDIRFSGNEAVCESFASYLAKQAKAQFKIPVKKLVLTERFVVIADPRYQPWIPYKTKLPHSGSRILLEKTF